MKRFKHLLAGIALMVISGMAIAESPPLINYRGHFDGPPAVAGQPVSQSLVFSLYNSMTATDPLWTETQQVSIYDGNFAVLLGSVTPLSAELFTEPIRYIGVRLETGSELMRQQIISVPYAMRADAADLAEVAISAETAQRADLATQAESATIADSATTAQTATAATRLGNLYAAANGNIGFQNANSNFMLTLGSGLGNTKLALWDNGDLSLGMGIQGGQYRFHIGQTTDRFSFFDRAKPTIIGGVVFGKTSGNPNEEQDQANGVEPEQIFDPGPIRITEDPKEIFTIRGNGRVGIGRVDPQQALDVAGSIRVSGSYTTSDLRLKKNIASLDHSLESIMHLRGVEYEWRRDEFQDHHFSEGKQIGLIAQEVEEVMPEIVFTDQDDFKSVDYNRLIPVLVEAMKEQQKQIQSLNDEIEALKRAK